MKIERDERKFDFHGIGLAIKKARERDTLLTVIRVPLCITKMTDSIRASMPFTKW